MNDSHLVGIDIGGAHLKYADASGKTHASSFPMWKQHERLAEALTTDLSTTFPGATDLAVTMTGELADCFLDRQEGVDFIVDATMQAARNLGVHRVAFYQVDGYFADQRQARNNADLIAASNWHASATWISRSSDRPTPGTAMVIDIGSTTTDIIPINSQGVATRAQTDFDRLAEGSLVYLGSSRTPVCAITSEVRYGGSTVPVMNELFATTDDVWLLLGISECDRDDSSSADGRPRTIAMAANRIARMIGLDHRTISIVEATRIAQQVFESAASRIREGLARNDNGGILIVIGHGASDAVWVQAIVGDRPCELLADTHGDQIARVFPAYAVCKLLQSSSGSIA